MAAMMAAAPPAAQTGALPEWLKVGMLAGAGIGAIITGTITIASWRFQVRLAAMQSKLGEDVQRRLDADRAERNEGLEHLKRDLSDSLAQRTRRAEYVKAQLQHLYGPLGFLVESSARHLDVNRDIMKGYHEYFGKFTAPGSERASQETDQVIETANRYVRLVVDNNKEAVKILREGWGWLDPDDIDETSQYLTDIARHAVEFEEKGLKLPLLFYVDEAMDNAVGAPSFIRLAFIARVRTKLLQEQQELAGLTGAAVSPVVMRGVVQAAISVSVAAGPESHQPAPGAPIELPPPDGGAPS